MTDPMKKKLCEAMCSEAVALVEKDFDQVFDAFQRSFEEAEPGQKFKYNVPVTVTLVPCGTDVRVLSSIRATAPAFKDESQGRIVTPEADMFGE